MEEKEKYKELSKKLIQQWKEEKLRLNKGATEEELNDFERELNVRLPEDIRYFYSLVNGMDGCDDKYLFELWPLDYILKKREGKFIFVITTKLGIEIPFGDYLFDSHRYYLFFDNFGVSHIGSDADKPSKLTDSFTNFLELYLFDPDKIYLSL